MEMERKVRNELILAMTQVKRLEDHEIEILNLILGDNLDSWLVFFDNRYQYAMQLSDRENATQIEVFPFEGVGSIGNTIKDYSDFQTLLEKVNEWDRKDAFLLNVHYFLGPLKRLDFDRGREFFSRWINEELGKGTKDAFEYVVRIIAYFDFRDMDDDNWRAVLHRGIEFNQFEKAKSAFRWSIGLTESYSWGEGDRGEQAERKEKCDRLIDKCGDPQIRFFLRQCSQSLDKVITENQIEL
jgi:hypothetical protein